MGSIIEAGDADFDTVVKADEWVLVDFWAPWCGPCRMVSPILELIAGEREMTIAKVNVDNNPIVPGRYGVRGIPTLLLFKDGEKIDEVTGAMQKGGFDAWLDRHM